MVQVSNPHIPCVATHCTVFFYSGVSRTVLDLVLGVDTENPDGLKERLTTYLSFALQSILVGP